MDVLRELLDLAIRWTHVIAGIMWIGNSLLFNWLDRNLQPPTRARAGSRGTAWLLHSGGFYDVEKTLDPGATVPRPLHWFKWQAYTTWLTGAALLVVVYWLNGAALLMSAATPLSAPAGRFISAAALAAGFVVYEMIWKAPRPGSTATRAAVSFLLLLGLAAALGRVFNGRATFLHVGAVLGTIMAGNVFFHIMPAQRAMVDAIAHGRPADPGQSDRAKLRSIHNNYMTFPVIALMLGSHFPGLYSHSRALFMLAVLLLGGAAVRHILNIRFGWAAWAPALAATVVVSLAALWLLAARPFARDDTAPAGLAPVTLEEATAVVRKRCAVCHSTSPADRSFGIAPGGVAFDTPEQIEALASRIRVRAVETLSMPPNNRTWMTDAERELLGRWVRQHAP